MKNKTVDLKIKGIHHVAIKAKGMQAFKKTVEFYVEILGLELLRQWEREDGCGVMVDTGGGILEIFSNAECEPERGPLRHIALAVESPDKCIEKVREAGYKVTVEPKDITIPSFTPYNARIAFCIGAAGEEIEFFKEK